MKFRFGVFTLLIVLLISIPFSFSETEYPKLDPRKKYSSSEVVKYVSDAYWQRILSDSIYLRIKYGLPITRLTDISYDKGKADLNFASTMSAQLKRAKKAELNQEELLTVMILERNFLNIMQSFHYFWLNFPVTPYASPIPVVHLAFTSYQFHVEKDQQAYLALLGSYPHFIASLQKHLESQLEKKIVIPAPEIDQVVPFLNSYIKENPAQSDFYVDQSRLKAFPDPGVMAFQKNVSEIIQAKINPALKNLADYIGTTYRKEAPQGVGLSQYPDGKEYYRFLVKYHTTMDITPEEVHQIGLAEVERLNKQMREIQESIGFKGTEAEFRAFLDSDQRFIPRTPDEIGETLLALNQKILPKIPAYFLKQPKAPYGVKRLDPSLEGSMTFGYYQVPTKADPTGYYYYNGSNLKERSLLDAGSLIYHELIPGHHFQINLQSENESLPEFRKEGDQTAYFEGWAEYASDLAGEIGMYQGQYDQLGRLTADLFLTVRLVVDTGMNYMDWPLSKAVDYMKQNTLLSDTQIHTESLRYSTDIPGQALAYKMGSQKIKQLRKKSEDALKEKFDIRKFHDAVLGSGSMPMNVLEMHIDQFIKSESGR